MIVTKLGSKIFLLVFRFIYTTASKKMLDSIYLAALPKHITFTLMEKWMITDTGYNFVPLLYAKL